MSMFGFVKTRQFKRNKFRLGYQSLLTLKPGVLYPFYVQKTVPGDSFVLNNRVLMRLAPMQAPIMQDLDVKTEYFYVPNRIIWKNWRRFITQGSTGEANIPYPEIICSAESIKTGTLADFLRFPDPFLNGWPDDGDADSPRFPLDALPFRAYQMIWNEFYRDENLQDPVAFGFDVDGQMSERGIVKDDTETNGEVSNLYSEILQLRRRSYKKDYFTSALPFAQRGEEVELPLVGDGSVKNIDGSSLFESYGRTVETYGTPQPTASGNSLLTRRFGDDPTTEGPIYDNNNNPLQVKSFGDLSTLNVDLSNVSAATINELRRAFAAQEFLEARARGGNRYIEYLLSIFGVKSSDGRLQRPQFIGSGKSPVVISDVLQTSQTTDSSPQATPSGHGVGIQKVNGLSCFCEEEGYIIGLISVMPKASYYQGMPREYTLRDPLDFYNPYFAHLGEQEITNGELFYNYNVSGKNELLFGYTPRYAEYKVRMNEIHGDFRTSLDYWHMARSFDQAPGLNPDFLTNMDNVNRVFSVQDAIYDKFWCMVENQVTAYRKMPKFGTPRLL